MLETADEIRRAKQSRNEYYRAWRKANPDKTRAAQVRYWARRLERMKAARLETPEGKDPDNPHTEDGGI